MTIKFPDGYTVEISNSGLVTAPHNAIEVAMNAIIDIYFWTGTGNPEYRPPAGEMHCRRRARES